MSGVCQRCGAPAETTIELRGLIFANIPSCVKCRDESVDELAHLRAKFNAMIEAGVDRKTANEVMTRWYCR